MAGILGKTANNIKDYFLGPGSRYRNAADNYKKATDKILDTNNIKNEASNFASNANAATRDSVYKQARSLGYGKGLAMNRAKQAANETSSANYNNGLNNALSLADKRTAAAQNNFTNQTGATGNQIKASQQAFSNLMNTGAAIAYLAGGGSTGTLAKKFLSMADK